MNAPLAASPSYEETRERRRCERLCGFLIRWRRTSSSSTFLFETGEQEVKQTRQPQQEPQNVEREKVAVLISSQKRQDTEDELPMTQSGAGKMMKLLESNRWKVVWLNNPRVDQMNRKWILFPPHKGSCSTSVVMVCLTTARAVMMVRTPITRSMLIQT